MCFREHSHVRRCYVIGDPHMEQFIPMLSRQVDVLTGSGVTRIWSHEGKATAWVFATSAM